MPKSRLLHAPRFRQLVIGFERTERGPDNLPKKPDNATFGKILSPVLTTVFLATLFLSLATSALLPIYSDEAATHWLISRFFLESQQIYSLFPQCSTTAGRETPLVFYPAAIAYSTIFSTLDPFGLRLSGLVLSVLSISGIAYWCYRLTRSGGLSGINLFSVLLAAGTLGVMPYLWAFFRPEQIITASIIFFSIAALFLSKIPTRHTRPLWAVAYLLMASCFFYVHPKTIFFLPFVIACLWFSTGSFSTPFRLLLVATVLFMAVGSYRNATALSACENAPGVQNIVAKNALSPSLLLNAPKELVSRGLSNVAYAPTRVIRHLQFQETYQSGWLPPTGQLGTFPETLNFFIALSFSALLIVPNLAAVYLVLRSLFAAEIEPRLLLAGALSIGNISNAFFYNQWNFYGGAQLIPSSIVLVLLLLRQPARSGTSASISRIVYDSLIVLAIISTLFSLSRFAPQLLDNTSADDAAIPGQSISIPTLTAWKHIDSIKELARTCDLQAESGKHLVVDHMTYYAFSELKAPIHVLYVSRYFGQDLAGERLVSFLDEKGSPGIITRCEWIPTQFGGKVHRNSRGYCCASMRSGISR